ncbi:LacI family DNA-binding transcriptional regulator [Pararobbsia alpina]|uniref:LacI family DNA-binding transcriptional regulator n=1 Tax=Pararobbsia alpina TaxID=621374 RepID=UPI0039A646DE
MPARKRRNSGRATLQDVAQRVGVTSITVSRYFQQPSRVSAEMRERIATAVAELGYVPNLVAGNLASAKSRVIGMVIPNISGPIFANTIQSFSDVLTAHGYQLLLASSYFSAELEENAVRAFLGWSPAALVLTSHHHSAGTERMIARTKVPVVETWDYQPHRAPMQVGFAHHQVGRMAAHYLIERGYRRIAFVQNHAAGDISALDRRDGYVEVMNAHGLKPWVFVPKAEAPFEAGQQALEALTARRYPADAIAFANDNLAAGALLAAQRAGIDVPTRCAIMGFGDYAFSPLLSPNLTTIRPPARAIGEIAAMRVLHRLGVVDDDTQAGLPTGELECELVARESA